MEISSPHLEADLRSLQFAQDADTLYIVRSTGTYKPKKLTRSSHTSWQPSDVNFLDGPFKNANMDTAATITPSPTTGNITLTPVATLITNGTFNTDIAGWTNKSEPGGSISWDGANQRLSLNSGPPGQSGWAEQALSTTPGNTYTLIFDIYQNWTVVYVGSTSGGSDILSGSYAVYIETRKFVDIYGGGQTSALQTVNHGVGLKQLSAFSRR